MPPKYPLHNWNTARSMLSCSFDHSSDQVTFFQSSLVQFFVSSCEFLVSVSCSQLTGVAPSVIFHCCSPSTLSCVFREALLHTLVVRSYHLNYCCLSIDLKQAGHSPLAWTRHFCSLANSFSFLTIL